MSDRVAILNKNPTGTSPNLSPQVIINCNAGGNCDGGEPSGVYQWASKHGLPDSTCQAYVAANSKAPHCSALQVCETCAPSNKSFSPGACTPVTSYPTWNITDFGSVSTFAKIQAEIYANGPIAATMMVTARFEEYAGGIYSENAGPIEANHAVSIVGWGVTTGSSPQQYAIVRNSWGEAFGEDGYFYMTTEPSLSLGLYQDGTWGDPNPTPNWVSTGEQ
jgi:cathepsin X